MAAKKAKKKLGIQQRREKRAVQAAKVAIAKAPKAKRGLIRARIARAAKAAPAKKAAAKKATKKVAKRKAAKKTTKKMVKIPKSYVRVYCDPKLNPHIVRVKRRKVSKKK